MVNKRELEKLSVEDLEKQVVAIDVEIEKLREDKRKVARTLEAKVETEAAEAQVATLSDSQRAALVQAVKTAPVLSAEGVGTPGNGNGEG